MERVGRGDPASGLGADGGGRRRGQGGREGEVEVWR